MASYIANVPDPWVEGRALDRSGTEDVIDAQVVVGCLDRGDAVVTSDPGDLRALADAQGKRLNVIAI